MPLPKAVAFPLFAIVEGKCACGDLACSRVGKHPAVAWGDLSFGDPVPRPVPGAGYGLKTGAAPKGSGVIVIDLDGPEALASFRTFGDCPFTFAVDTPRGLHLYFRHPGFPVKNSAGALGPGIDVRGDGGFVVGPDSPHRSGGTYTVGCDEAPAPCPTWLVSLLNKAPALAPVQTYAGDVTEPIELARRRDLYAKYLREEAPARGPALRGKGDAVLFDVVQRGAWDLALPTAHVLELIREHYDPRCSPQWGAELNERVTHKAHDAKTRSTRERIEPVPEDLAPIFSGAAFQEIDPIALTSKPIEKTEIFWDDWDEPVAPPTWLVEGLIPVATVGALVAHGSSLKTWTVLSVGAAIAQGVPWLDKFATRKGRVLVVDYESGLYEIRRRIHLLEGGRVQGLGAWCYPDKFLDDVELWKRLASIEGVSLLCIDSLAAGASPGTDENSAAADRPLKLAARYSEGTGASVLFVHHSKKDDGGDARKSVRGSTAIFAALDWCYAFDAVEETPQYKRMSMSCIKPCMGAKPPPVPLELSDLNGLRSYEGVPVLDRGASDSDIIDHILFKLRAEPIGAIDLIAKAIHTSCVRVRPLVKSLIKQRRITDIDGIGFVADEPSDRKERVLNLLARDPLWGSDAQLAKAAHVKTDEIEAFIKEGIIFPSADGRYLVK